MSKNKLSIIMPILNVNSHIGLFKKCLDGIIKQSFTKWELIIAIDGGPNERDVITLCNILNERKDKRIMLYALENKKPIGPGLVRNYCIKYSSGNLITFHDSDDFSNKDRFSVLIGYLIKNKKDVVASYVSMNFTEAPKENRIRGFSGKTLDAFMKYGKIKPPIHMSSAIMTKKIFQDIGGFESYKFSSDSIFAIKLGYFLELVKKDGIPIIKDPLFVWNRRSESITMDQRNAKHLRRCIGKQRSQLLQELQKIDFNSKVMSDTHIKQSLGIRDNLEEDNVGLKLIFGNK